MSSEQRTVAEPSKKVFEFLKWAASAAVNEYCLSTDDHTDYDAACAWLNEVGKVCGYE